MSNVEEQNAAWEREQMAALDAELGPHVVTVPTLPYPTFYLTLLPYSTSTLRDPT